MFLTMILALAMVSDPPAVRRGARHGGSPARTARARRLHAADMRAARMMNRASARLTSVAAPQPLGPDRVGGSPGLATDRKSDALADTGQKCTIIGQALCQRKRRTVFRTAM